VTHGKEGYLRHGARGATSAGSRSIRTASQVAAHPRSPLLHNSGKVLMQLPRVLSRSFRKAKSIASRLLRPRPPQPPQIVFFGAHLRTLGYSILYGLRKDARFAICDRDERRVGTRLERLPIYAVDDVDITRAERVVITEEPATEDFEDAIAYLKERGVPDDRILHFGQPGSIHRLIAGKVNLSPERAREVAYKAVRQNLFHRSHYAYCMLLAAEEALRMDLHRITALEFGVWTGKGLINMCEVADFLQQTLGVQFDLYGFDTGAGLPTVADYRDHPELWASGSLVMPDFEALSRRLPPSCKLILGDIADTLPRVMAEHLGPHAPVGFVVIDVDQYHSTRSTLKLFEAPAEHLLPAIPIWVDDSYIGVMQTRWAGEALALHEFNDKHPLRKMEQKIVRTEDAPRLWHHSIWFAHIFDHPVRQGLRPARFDQFNHTKY
jgi:hypothetical protein